MTDEASRQPTTQLPTTQLPSASSTPPESHALQFRFSAPRRATCAVFAAFGALSFVDGVAALAGVGNVAVSNALTTIAVGGFQVALFVWLYLGHVTVTPEGIDSQALRHRHFPISEIADVRMRVVPTATYMTTYAPYVIRKNGSRARLAPLERIQDSDRVAADTQAIRTALGLP